MLDPRRMNALGGTDIAILSGHCPPSWGNARSIWLEKNGLVVKAQNDPMTSGKMLEDAVARYYRDVVLSDRVITDQLYNHFVINEADYLCGTFDMFWRDEGNLPHGAEFKTTGFAEEWGPSGSDKIPMRVRIQINVYMYLAGLDEWDVVALIGERGFQFRHYKIKRDNALIEECKQIAFDYYAKWVATGTMPPDEPQPVAIDSVDDLAFVGNELASAIEELANAKNLLDLSTGASGSLTEAYNQAAAKVKDLMGSVRYAEYGGWLVDWDRRSKPDRDFEAAYAALKRRVLDKDPSEAEFISALEQVHTKQKQYQRFTIKPAKVSK